MGKNSKSKIEYDGINFDSNEELEFYHWCIEAKRYKIISDFKYNCETYQLSPKQTTVEIKQLKTKSKEVTKHLFHEHVYSPDFHLFKGERWGVLDKNTLLSLHGYNNEFVIDIKGSFQLHDGSRSFSINQKWMFDKYRIYINKVIPEKFFKLTWLPEKCKFSPKKKQIRKKYEGIPTIAEKFGNLGSQDS
jgi:hypothetical protein